MGRLTICLSRGLPSSVMVSTGGSKLLSGVYVVMDKGSRLNNERLL